MPPVKVRPTISTAVCVDRISLAASTRMPWLVATHRAAVDNRTGDGAAVEKSDAGARRYLAAVAEEAGDSLLRELDAETQRRADHGARSVDQVAGKIGVLGNENAGAAQSPDRAAVDDASGKIADVEDSDGAEAAADKDAFVGDTAGKAKIAENVDGGELRADDTDGAVDDAAGEARHGINQDAGPERRSQRGNRTAIGNATGKLGNVEDVNTAGEPSDNPSLVDNAAQKTQVVDDINAGKIRSDDGADVVDNATRKAGGSGRSECRFDLEPRSCRYWLRRQKKRNHPIQKYRRYLPQ